MHLRSATLPAIVLATLSLGLAAPAFAQGASPASPAPGTAHIRTTGMVEADLVLPVQAEKTAATDSGYDLRFQDHDLDTLNISLTVTNGTVTDAFVAVGVPGTTIDEPAYFADFFHTQCTVHVTSLDTTGVAGTIECTDLGNGEGSGTVSLRAAFDTGAIGGPAVSPTPATHLERPAAGTAHIRTTGMVESDLVLPVQREMTRTTDSGYDLQFQDAHLDTLYITLTVTDGNVTDAFVGVGVPGDWTQYPTYFSDPWHILCTVDVTSHDAAGVAGTIDCTDLVNGDGSGTVSLRAAFDTGVIEAATPSASPVAQPSASPAS